MTRAATKKGIEWATANLVGKTIAAVEDADVFMVDTVRLRFSDGSTCLIFGEYDEGVILGDDDGRGGD